VWFQNNCRAPTLRSQFSFNRKVSLKQVACHIFKAEIAAIAAERANGARPGTTGYLPVFQGAVETFMTNLTPDQKDILEAEHATWNSEGHPDAVKRKTVERNGRTYLRQTAEVLWREMGMKPLIWEYHVNKAGQKLFQLYVRVISLCSRHDIDNVKAMISICRSVARISLCLKTCSPRRLKRLRPPSLSTLAMWKSLSMV